jgi:hypothetical protein
LIMLCGTVYIVKAVLHEALPNCARLTGICKRVDLCWPQ